MRSRRTLQLGGPSMTPSRCRPRISTSIARSVGRVRCQRGRNCMTGRSTKFEPRPVQSKCARVTARGTAHFASIEIVTSTHKPRSRLGWSSIFRPGSSRGAFEPLAYRTFRHAVVGLAFGTGSSALQAVEPILSKGGLLVEAGSTKRSEVPPGQTLQIAATKVQIWSHAYCYANFFAFEPRRFWEPSR